MKTNEMMTMTTKAIFALLADLVEADGDESQIECLTAILASRGVTVSFEGFTG